MVMVMVMVMGAVGAVSIERLSFAGRREVDTLDWILNATVLTFVSKRESKSNGHTSCRN